MRIEKSKNFGGGHPYIFVKILPNLRVSFEKLGRAMPSPYVVLPLIKPFLQIATSIGQMGNSN